MNISPMRVVRKAFTAASRALVLPYQNPISKYEHRPMISQPMYRVSKLSLTTSRYMAAAKRLTKAKKRAYIGSIEGTRLVSFFTRTSAPRGGRPGWSSLPAGWPKLW